MLEVKNFNNTARDKNRRRDKEVSEFDGCWWRGISEIGVKLIDRERDRQRQREIDR